MAREKRPAHRSPDSLVDPDRDITSAQVELVRNQNTHERREALVHCSVPEETPIPVGFSNQKIEQAQKRQRQRNLEKARGILDRRQNGDSVTWTELDWARALCAREAKLEEAESDLSSSRASDAAALETGWVLQKEVSVSEPGDDECGDGEDQVEDDNDDEDDDDVEVDQAQSQAPIHSPLDDSSDEVTAEENIVTEDPDEDIWDEDIWDEDI